MKVKDKPAAPLHGGTQALPQSVKKNDKRQGWEQVKTCLPKPGFHIVPGHSQKQVMPSVETEVTQRETGPRNGTTRSRAAVYEK